MRFFPQNLRVSTKLIINATLSAAITAGANTVGIFYDKKEFESSNKVASAVEILGSSIGMWASSFAGLTLLYVCYKCIEARCENSDPREALLNDIEAFDKEECNIECRYNCC